MGCGASAGSNYKASSLKESPGDASQPAPATIPAANTSPQTATEPTESTEPAAPSEPAAPTSVDAAEISTQAAALSDPAAPTSGDAAEIGTQVSRPAGRWRTAIAPDMQVDEFQEPAVADGSKKAVARAGEALSQALQSRRLEEVLEQHQFEAEPPTKGEGEAEIQEEATSIA